MCERHKPLPEAEAATPGAKNREYKTFGRSRSLPLPGFDYTQAYLAFYVTMCVKDKQRLLTDKSRCAAAREALIASCKEEGYRPIAYCIMPDHVHALIQGGSKPRGLSSWVRRFKGVSQRALWTLGVEGKVWQRGFYDHILRAYEDMEDIARYILANPVRAGLVVHSTDYPWSGLVEKPL
jgi:REP element-mobilizing transposase RayT